MRLWYRRSGKQYDTVRQVEVPPEAAAAATAAQQQNGGAPAAHYQSSGVRKAVLLARLTDALQCWCVGGACLLLRCCTLYKIARIQGILCGRRQRCGRVF
jgi:hypothetical protein